MPRLKIIPVSEARPNLAALVDEANQEGEPCFITSRGRVKAVLLGIEEYEALRERLEDLEDSIDVLRARVANEPSRPYEDFLKDIEAEPLTLDWN